MIFPVDGDYRITDGYDVERGDHIHGAIDIAVPEMTPIHAPEDGDVFYHYQHRLENKTHNLYWPNTNQWYQFSNYFNQDFGCLVFLQSKSGITHVFAHINPQDIIELINYQQINIYFKQDKVSIFLSSIASPKKAKAGDLIGFSGNYGKSTGPHVHYECHKNYKWLPWDKRPNPESMYQL